MEAIIINIIQCFGQIPSAFQGERQKAHPIDQVAKDGQSGNPNVGFGSQAVILPKSALRQKRTFALAYFAPPAKAGRVFTASSMSGAASP